MSHRDEGYSMGKGYIIIILIGSAVNNIHIIMTLPMLVINCHCLESNSNQSVESKLAVEQNAMLL